MPSRPIKHFQFLNLSIALVSFVLTLFLLGLHREKDKSNIRSTLYAPPTTIKYFTFGHKETTADSFWMRALQDIDLCEQNFAPKGQSRVDKNRVHNCDRGWVYHILDVVMECAPRWRLPAAIGPLMLSVIVDDIQGASILFKKSVKNFPTDWTIHFRAGYHFLYETEDMLFAAQLFETAAKNGAPLWVHSLAGKLFSDSGRLFVARTVLTDALNRTPPGQLRDKIKKRLLDIHEKIKNKSN